MNNFNIDEMMEAATYVEWKMVMKITAEQEAYMCKPSDRYEIMPRTWFHEDGSIIEQTVYLYKIDMKEDTYEVFDIALYATEVKRGKTTFLQNLFTNYQVIKEILRRLGLSQDSLTREQWESICYRRMKATVDSKTGDKRWNNTRSFMNNL